MGIEFEKDDRIRVHERGVIAQLCSLFRSHEHGLPEWFKNSSTAYAKTNTPTEHRVLTVLFGRRPSDGEQYIALLDHVGMSVEDLEQRFANWGDPEAHLGGAGTTEEILEGGHGNGGKCYMTQMFAHSSYLHTVRAGRGSRYGFLQDDPSPGYFPSKRTGRGFPVASPVDELRRTLRELGVDFGRLPEEARLAAAACQGFTLVVGIGPKHLTGRGAEKKLLVDVLGHPQMGITIQKNRIYAVVGGVPVPDMSPVVLPEIEPHEYAPEPRLVEIPDELPDPMSGEMCPTREGGAPRGSLVLRTSRVSMRWKLKSRHNITFMAHGKPVAFMAVDDVSRSAWVDKMYGTCKLDSVAKYETPDRSALADAPMTRALRNWVKEQLLEYEGEFRKQEHLEASQEKRNKAQELNQFLDQWKNRFLEETMAASGTGGPGKTGKTKKRPLRQRQPESVRVSSSYDKAGVGVWVRPRVEFLDGQGERVAPVAFAWNSSDWAVATVDEQGRIVTHTPGTTDIWLETVDGRLRSASLTLEVLDTATCRVEPTEISIEAGKVAQLRAIVKDKSGAEHHDVLMTWLQDDSSVIAVTATGKIIGQRAGVTRVCAVDEQCIGELNAASVTVTPATATPGDDGGKAFPKILLSEFDPDPLNPDGETVHLAPEDGPVHQPTPQHVEHNIWWINLQCPMAKLYFEEFGPDSREWRSYHIERYIEALAKISLAAEFQVAEEEMTFDAVELRWRQVAADVQRRALDDLRSFLDGGPLEPK